MASRASKIFVAVAAVLVIIGYVYSMDKDTVFSAILEPITPVDWSEVSPKYIIEYSIPITIVEENGNDCTVYTKTLSSAIYHGKFTRGADLANELKFNEEEETIVIPCDKMQGDPSKFTVWYVSPGSNVHEGKYEYFIDPYDGTLGKGIGYVFDETGEN